MDHSTINISTFLLQQWTTIVPGAVIYSGFTAPFTPSALHAPGIIYTETISTAAKKPAGNALTSNYVWSIYHHQIAK